MPPEPRPAARWSCLSLSRLLQRRPDDPWSQPFQVARVDHPAWRLVGLTLKTMKVAAHGHHQAMLSGQLLVDRDLLRLVAAGVDLQGIDQGKDLLHQVLVRDRAGVGVDGSPPAAWIASTASRGEASAAYTSLGRKSIACRTLSQACFSVISPCWRTSLRMAPGIATGLWANASRPSSPAMPCWRRTAIQASLWRRRTDWLRRSSAWSVGCSTSTPWPRMWRTCVCG